MKKKIRRAIKSALHDKQTTIHGKDGQWVMVIGLSKDKFDDDEQDDDKQDEALIDQSIQTAKSNYSWFD